MPRAPREFVIGGVERVMYTSGHLAEALGREVQSILKWEKQGTLPKTPFRAKTGRRLYTKEQMEAIVETVDKYELRQGMAPPKEFILEIHQKFKEATASVIGG